jgi:hypothetical protein
MNRFNTPFGNDGFGEPSDLKCYSGFYRFDGHTYGITVWAHDIAEASQYCIAHGLTFQGEIIERIDN